MKNSIFTILKKLDLSSEESRKVFSNQTRDVQDLTVWKDDISDVIFIDEFYTGVKTYEDGNYRDLNQKKLGLDQPYVYEGHKDAQRRFKENLGFISGKNVADFGCGSGDFLKLIKPYCVNTIGVELELDYVNSLNNLGINCFQNLNDLEDKSLDVIVSFHVLEHLPDPVKVLIKIKSKIKSGGLVIIEVPHARDLLLTLGNENYKKFTLWSQHLILHTRESLRKLLQFTGFTDVEIEGVQRYPLSNHLNWLANGEPGGHKSLLSIIDSDDLSKAYCNSLSKLDHTDTLIAVARVP